MGENARYNGEVVKIGTCEDMYYLRADQMHKVRPVDGSVDPVAYKHELRFRFPFPDEDHIAPGAFEDHDRGVPIDDVAPPEDVEHGIVQLTGHPGYLLNLPCPIGAKGAKLVKDAALKLHKNGWSGALKIVQQRILKNGIRCIVVECNACRTKYRVETLEEVLPYVEALERKADSEDHWGSLHGEKERGSWYRKIAERIREGYQVPTSSSA